MRISGPESAVFFSFNSVRRKGFLTFYQFCAMYNGLFKITTIPRHCPTQNRIYLLLVANREIFWENFIFRQRKSVNFQIHALPHGGTKYQVFMVEEIRSRFILNENIPLYISSYFSAFSSFSYLHLLHDSTGFSSPYICAPASRPGVFAPETHRTL